MSTDTSNYAQHSAAVPISQLPQSNNEQQNVPLIQQDIIKSTENRLKLILRKFHLTLTLPKLDSQEDKDLIFKSEFCGPICLVLILAIICMVATYHFLQVFLGQYQFLLVQQKSVLICTNFIIQYSPLATLVSLIGYCMAPINTAQFIIFCIPCIQEVIQILIMIIGTARAIQSANTLLNFVSPDQKSGLVTYPVGLFYFYVGYLAYISKVL